MTETERTALLQACAFASVFMQSADAELRGASPQHLRRSGAQPRDPDGRASHRIPQPRRDGTPAAQAVRRLPARQARCRRPVLQSSRAHRADRRENLSVGPRPHSMAHQSQAALKGNHENHRTGRKRLSCCMGSTTGSNAWVVHPPRTRVGGTVRTNRKTDRLHSVGEAKE